MNSTHRNSAVLVAVSDPIVHPEAVHIAAATGRSVIDTTDPHEIARAAPRVSAIIIDAPNADALNLKHQRERIFLVASDTAAPDWKLAMEIHAQGAFLLPAQTQDLLAVIGRSDVTSANSGTVIGVLGAAGGVGTSTIAATLARRQQQHSTTVLIDAVANSGGIDLLLGIENVTGARWPDVGFGRGTVHAADVISALPKTPDNLAVLSVARSTVLDYGELGEAEIKAALDCFRGSEESLDVIVDMGAGIVPAEIVDMLDHVVLVVPAEVRAVAAASTMLLRLQEHRIPASIILRHRGWSGLDVGEVEQILHTNISAELGVIARLAKQVEMQGLTGNIPKALGTLSDAIVADLQAPSWT